MLVLNQLHVSVRFLRAMTVSKFPTSLVARDIRVLYEVEFNGDETDHVLGNLCILADLCNDRSQWYQRLCASALKCVLCVACAVLQNMISLIVVEFYLVRKFQVYRVRLFRRANRHELRVLWGWG